VRRATFFIHFSLLGFFEEGRGDSLTESSTQRQFSHLRPADPSPPPNFGCLNPMIQPYMDYLYVCIYQAGPKPSVTSRLWLFITFLVIYTPINSSFYTLHQCDVTYVACISDFQDKNMSDVHLSFGFLLPFQS
jgi:hypothetical protein